MTAPATQTAPRAADALGEAHDDEAIRYYLEEAAIMRNPADPRRIEPDFPLGARVLDVGCGTYTPSRHDVSYLGIDISDIALAARRRLGIGGGLLMNGERLGFPDRSFSFVMSRVGIPYMRPAFFAEAARVLRPGGRIWLTCHPLRVALAKLHDSLRAARPKAALFQIYVLANTVLMHFTGRSFAFAGRFEYCQTDRILRRELSRNGFEDVTIDRSHTIRGWRYHYLVTAVQRLDYSGNTRALDHSVRPTRPALTRR